MGRDDSETLALLRTTISCARCGAPTYLCVVNPTSEKSMEDCRRSIRRECLDHIVVFSEWHLRHVLLSYMDYYNCASEHPSVYVVEEKRFC